MRIDEWDVVGLAQVEDAIGRSVGCWITYDAFTRVIIHDSVKLLGRIVLH